MTATHWKRGRNWVTAGLALVVWISSYQLGREDGARAPSRGRITGPIDPATAALMRDAAARARGQGNPAAAAWFDALGEKSASVTAAAPAASH
jgi:hypothetical protein